MSFAFEVRICIVDNKADAAWRLLAGAVRARPGDVARQNRGHILDQRAAHAFWSLSVIRTRSGAELKEEKACLGHLASFAFEPHVHRSDLVQQAGPVTASYVRSGKNKECVRRAGYVPVKSQEATERATGGAKQRWKRGLSLQSPIA